MAAEATSSRDKGRDSAGEAGQADRLSVVEWEFDDLGDCYGGLEGCGCGCGCGG